MAPYLGLRGFSELYIGLPGVGANQSKFVEKLRVGRRHEFLTQKPENVQTFLARKRFDLINYFSSTHRL
jgi:hypothetical protein